MHIYVCMFIDIDIPKDLLESQSLCILQNFFSMFVTVLNRFSFQKKKNLVKAKHSIGLEIPCVDKASELWLGDP